MFLGVGGNCLRPAYTARLWIVDPEVLGSSPSPGTTSNTYAPMTYESESLGRFRVCPAVLPLYCPYRNGEVGTDAGPAPVWGPRACTGTGAGGSPFFRCSGLHPGRARAGVAMRPACTGTGQGGVQYGHTVPSVRPHRALSMATPCPTCTEPRTGRGSVQVRVDQGHAPLRGRHPSPGAVP